MSESVRVGVAGTSEWAEVLHLPGIESHPGARLTAICGRRRERAREVAVKYDIPFVFTDYRAMIDSGELDALVIATPDETHHPIMMAALEAGLHVMCEKPLAPRASLAKEM